MSKVKIHIDEPDPNPETIRKYKNFNKVLGRGKLTRFQHFGKFRKLYFRHKTFRIILILIFILCLLLLLDGIF